VSIHSYSRCWMHIVWSTLRREYTLEEEARRRLSKYLLDYSRSKNVFMKINYVNADHVHVLIDLPTNRSVEQVVHLLKGNSSHWINENRLTSLTFSWGRGFGVFSVSESIVPKVALYIGGQAEHHKRRSFLEEYKRFVARHGLVWRDDLRETGH